MCSVARARRKSIRCPLPARCIWYPSGSTRAKKSLLSLLASLTTHQQQQHDPLLGNGNGQANGIDRIEVHRRGYTLANNICNEPAHIYYFCIVRICQWNRSLERSSSIRDKLSEDAIEIDIRHTIDESTNSYHELVPRLATGGTRITILIAILTISRANGGNVRQLHDRWHQYRYAKLRWDGNARCSEPNSIQVAIPIDSSVEIGLQGTRGVCWEEVYVL